jgi:hypothetical protein
MDRGVSRIEVNEGLTKMDGERGKIIQGNQASQDISS